MLKVKELQKQICELDDLLELTRTKFADYKITVSEYMMRTNEIIEQQTELSAEVANLRHEDFLKGEG